MIDLQYLMKEAEIHNLTERLWIHSRVSDIPSEKVELVIAMSSCQPVSGKIAC